MSKSDTSAEERFRDYIFECVECGKTVIFTENIFKPTHHSDSVYCPCEPQGVPMVPKYDDEEDDETYELAEGLEAAGHALSRWRRAPTRPTPGSCKVFCHDCGYEKKVWPQGTLDARTRAERVKAGHRNKGCVDIELIGNT